MNNQKKSWATTESWVASWKKNRAIKKKGPAKRSWVAHLKKTHEKPIKKNSWTTKKKSWATTESWVESLKKTGQSKKNEQLKGHE